MEKQTLLPEQPAEPKAKRKAGKRQKYAEDYKDLRSAVTLAITILQGEEAPSERAKIALDLLITQV